MKLTDTQRYQIKLIKKAIRQELKYVPRGQGDGVNQHLKIRELNWFITEIKEGRDVTQELRGRGIN